MKKTFLAFFAFMLTGMTMAEEAHNTIAINSEAELRQIADYIANGTDGQYHFILTSDITITLSVAWTPLGTPNSNNDGSFNGTFDGKGPDGTIHTININTNNANEYIVLFSRIGASGIVKNLKISGKIGSIAGVNLGTIENCMSSATVTCSANGADVGSIAGVNHGTIDNCISSATVTCLASGADVGGIVGENDGSTNSEKGIIKNCEFTGSLENNYTESPFNGTLGGIVGNNASFGVIQNCKSNPISISPSPYYSVTVGAK